MDWQSEMVPIVRTLIGDLDDTNYMYSDERLQSQILIGATQVLSEIDFPTKYYVTVSSGVLYPDPTTSSPIDDAFITLVTLKSCQILEYAEFRAAKQGGFMKVSDGTSSFDNQASFLAYKLALTNGFKHEYETFRREFKFGVYLPGKLVSTPFSSPNIVLSNYYVDFRDRFR